MTDSIELRASLNSIKRVDPYVKTILCTATQVALYKFNIAQSEWEKTDKEGALFLYSRNGEPYHSVMILNRLNKDNFIEPIIKDIDYQVQLPFLLYRNCKSKIFGIWFFNKDECIRVASFIESLMDKEQGDDGSRFDRRQNEQGNMDIFSMLSKAQEDFSRTPTKQDSVPPTFSSTPRVPDMTSQSVMDFFAKASTKTAQKAPAPEENVLHRLMSNPAHSVEHIEKQQRSVTPQEQVNNYRAEAIGGPDRRSVPINFASTSGSQRKKDSYEVNGLNIPSVSPPKPIIASSPLACLMQNQLSTTQFEENSEVLGTSPFQQFLEIAHKPLLMTPMMFTAPNPTKENTSASSTNNSGDGVEPVEMLTEKQLAQALIYLLKNNSNFIRQIHQAYTNSILEKVDKSRYKTTL